MASITNALVTDIIIIVKLGYVRLESQQELAAQHRGCILDAATRLFRERGPMYP